MHIVGYLYEDYYDAWSVEHKSYLFLVLAHETYGCVTMSQEEDADLNTIKVRFVL